MSTTYSLFGCRPYRASSGIETNGKALLRIQSMLAWIKKLLSAALLRRRFVRKSLSVNDPTCS